MNPKGLTIIELLVYIGVFTIVLIALSGFAFSIFATHNQAQHYNALEQQANRAMAAMIQAIQNGYAPDPTSSLSVDLAVTPASSVRINSNEAADNPYEISVVGGQLMLKKGGASAVPVHGKQIRTTHITIANFSQGRSNHLTVTADFESAYGLYGLPKARLHLSTSIELIDYAP